MTDDTMNTSSTPDPTLEPFLNQHGGDQGDDQPRPHTFPSEDDGDPTVILIPPCRIVRPPRAPKLSISRLQEEHKTLTFGAPLGPLSIPDERVHRLGQRPILGQMFLDDGRVDLVGEPGVVRGEPHGRESVGRVCQHCAPRRIGKGRRVGDIVSHETRRGRPRLGSVDNLPRPPGKVVGLLLHVPRKLAPLNGRSDPQHPPRHPSIPRRP